MKLNFSKLVHQEKFNKIREKLLLAGKFLHLETIKEPDIFNFVEKAFAVIGWSNLLKVNCPAYYEFDNKFLFTFKFDKWGVFNVNIPNIVRFRL